MRALICGVCLGMIGLTGAGAVESYDACLDLIERDPARAEREAGDWARFGGGAPARHCHALALIEVGAQSRAIDHLLALAAEEPDLSPEARVDILVQAGELLIEEGDTVTAEVVALQGLRLVPNAAGPLGLRASVKISKGEPRAAIPDLDEALARHGPDARLLALRASAHRQTGELIAARDDASFATEIAPDYATAWLERGRIEARIGDVPGARESLLTAIALDRDGEIGATAQNVLQRMEAGIE